MSPVTPAAKRFYKIAALAVVIGWPLALVAGSWVSGRDGPSASLADDLTLRSPRVVVLKSAGTLHVFDGDALVRTYPIRLGSDPLGTKLREGDGRTPEGRFRVCTKNKSSPHYRFLGIDYPGHDDAARGLRHGLISSGEAAAIGEAIDQGDCPLWTTALGGGVGLHGMSGVQGRTAGCIALSDEHVEELFNVLRIGDEIEILP